MSPVVWSTSRPPYRIRPEQFLAHAFARAKKAGIWYDAERETDGKFLDEVEAFFGVCIEGMALDGKHCLPFYVERLMPLSKRARWWARALFSEVKLEIMKARGGDKGGALNLLLNIFEAAHELGQGRSRKDRRATVRAFEASGRGVRYGAVKSIAEEIFGPRKTGPGKKP